MAFIKKIELPDNNIYDIKNTIIPVVGTQSAATGNWTGNIDIPTLYDGLTISYFLPWAPSGNATLNLTLSDGTTTGPINCYYGTSRLTTHYGKGMSIIMTYWSAGSISVDGTLTTDDRWVVSADYNTDATGYYLRRIYPNLKAGTNKIFPYTMIMQNADGRWESLVTSSTVNSTKTRNTHGFRLGQVLLMYANATYNADALVGTYNIWSMHSGLIDHRYSFNTENNATKGTTGYKPVYLVGTINNNDGLFYLDETWWTQTLPSTDNGKVYIYIGDAYDYYRMTFVDTQKFYKYTNGALREISQDTVTANGHTVNKDVPSDAVFTDRYVNSASFAHDSTNNNVKMTLTRAGSDTNTVTANIPKVSSSTAGVVPKGASVSSQSQSTKFLREDGSWAAPSYTTNTNTWRNINVNGTKVLGTGTGTGALDFKDGTNTAVTYDSGVKIDATDEKVKLTLLETDAHKTYYVPFKSVSTSIVYGNNGFIYQTKDGTTTADGYGGLRLGNPTASGTEGNRFGYLRIYSKSTSYCDLIQADITSSVTHTLPSKGGTIFNTGNLVAGDNITLTESNGVYSINGTANTDTKNTAGSTDTSDKIFLIGAKSQAANPQTYSDDQVYVANGSLYLTKANIDTDGTKDNKPALLIGNPTGTHLELDANELMAKGSTITTGPLYLNNNGGLVYANNKKVVRLTSDPTSGEVMIADGTDGQIKSSGWTINKSVPSNAVFTDKNVTQTNTTTNESYRLLFSSTADDTTRTEGARKSSKLQFNPSNCTLTFYNETTTSDNIPITFDFDIKDTTTGKTYSTNAYMKWYQDHGTTTSGLNMVIQSGGGIFLGGGEAPNKHYLVKTTDDTDPNNPVYKNYTNEETFITSDSSIHIQSNAGTITNRKGLQINNSLQLVPEQEDVATDNVGSIGTSNYRWSQGYFNKVFATFAGEAYVTAKNTNTSIAVSLDTGTTSNHGIWSSGYYDGTDYVADGKWIVYRGSDGVNYLDGIATKATQDSDGNVINSTYLKLSGGTLTGSFYVSGTTEKRISLKNPTNNNLEVYMASPTNGKHGLYSTGYLNGTTYTQSGKWLVMRDSDGKVYFNGCTIESSVPSDAVFTDKKVKTNLIVAEGNFSTYYLTATGNTNETAKSLYMNNNVIIRIQTGTASAIGRARLVLGNNTAEGTAGNCCGQLQLYGTDNGYSVLRQETGVSSSGITIYLPPKAGTIFNTGNLVAGDNITLTQSNGVYSINGTANTDTKNTAGSTDTSDKIFLIGAKSQAANPQTYSSQYIRIESASLAIGDTGTQGAITLYDGTSAQNRWGILKQTSGVSGTVIHELPTTGGTILNDSIFKTIYNDEGTSSQFPSDDISYNITDFKEKIKFMDIHYTDSNYLKNTSTGQQKSENFGYLRIPFDLIKDGGFASTTPTIRFSLSLIGDQNSYYLRKQTYGFYVLQSGSAQSGNQTYTLYIQKLAQGLTMQFYGKPGTAPNWGNMTVRAHLEDDVIRILRITLILEP